MISYETLDSGCIICSRNSESYCSAGRFWVWSSWSVENWPLALGACSPGLMLPRVGSELDTQCGLVPTGHPGFPACLLEAGGVREALGDLGTACLDPKTETLTLSTLLSRQRPPSVPHPRSAVRAAQRLAVGTQASREDFMPHSFLTPQTAAALGVPKSDLCLLDSVGPSCSAEASCQRCGGLLPGDSWVTMGLIPHA